MRRTKCQSGRSPTIEQGRRRGKAGEGSTVASRVETAPSEKKRLTSSNCKRKVDHNNPQLKHKRTKQANESDVQPSEIGMEHRVITSSVGDRDGLTLKGKSREGTELSRTPTDGVDSEDNAIDMEGADFPSTLSHAEDETTTSGPTTLGLLP
ncbi:hypothetical protein Syun_001518 [Stephania yunnanensis]|uniref:Uncharacterized protein n=1 Tax=Stephania yunnanensis TaxID=152371 RepID=A0AAP0LE04_9MAGN